MANEQRQCRGALSLGTACGHCPKCQKELKLLATARQTYAALAAMGLDAEKVLEMVPDVMNAWQKGQAKFDIETLVKLKSCEVRDGE